MKNIVVLIVLILPGYCFSQIHVSLSTGLAGFNMKEMKKHQLELRAQFPVDAKVIESFPAFWSYDLSLTGKLSDRVRIGGSIGFTSTGGRIHYRDYSGEMECEQLTTAWVPAFQSELLLNPKGKLPVSLTCAAGAMLGRYSLDFSLEVNNSSDSDNLKFKSTNFFLEPGIMANKRIVGKLSALVKAGYNINVFKSRQDWVEDKDLFLQDGSGKEVRLDWSGFRLGVGLSFEF
jgi:hypothetical protein